MDSPCSSSAGFSPSRGPRRGNVRGASARSCSNKATMTGKTATAPANCTARLHPFRVFVLFRPCYCRRAGPSDRRRGRPNSRFHPVAYVESTAREVVPATLFFSCYLQANRLGPSPAVRRLFQLEPERVGLVGDLAASDRV